MSVCKVIELIGSSPDGWEQAAKEALARAGRSLRELRVAEVSAMDIVVSADGEVEAYRTKLKVSFKHDG
jgi:flavin-binding protein dodecin